MKILAIETATEACSAALLIDGDIAVEYELAPRAHTKLIIPMMDRLLDKAGLNAADMDAIAFGQGPGAFTGLRIAAGVTHGVALAADLPVIPVSTLAALAQQCFKQHGATQILTTLDARINEVYWGKYVIQDNKAVLLDREMVVLPENIEAVTDGHWVGVGSGWEAYSEILHAKADGHIADVFPQMTPSAEYIAQLAAFDFIEGKLLTVEQAQPIYLRDKVAETVAERANAKQAG